MNIIQSKIKTLTHPDLINGKILKSIIFFTLPLLISQIFQQCYNAADTIIIGNYLGETSLAAIGATVAIFDLLVGFGIGFGNGLGIVAARAFGANDKEKLKKVTASSLVITFFLMILIFILSQTSLKSILRSLGTPDEIVEESFSYINTITKFAGVLFLYNLFAGMLRAIGNSFVPLLFLIFSSLLNIFLDITFIKYFGMGIKGAAIATVIAQGVSAILCLVYILKKAKILVPSLKHFSFDKRLYKDLIEQGLSMALMGAVVQSGTVLLQSSINSFGSSIIAGHICSRKIFSFTNIPLLTIGNASATFVSQNFGANKIDRVKRGVNYCMILSLVWTVILLIFFPFTIKSIASFISGSSNPELLNYTFKYMMFAVPFYLVLGGVFIIRNSLQGMGYKVLPVTSSIIELIGKILFVFFIIPKMQLWGIIMCEPLIWTVMFIFLMISFYKNPIIKSGKI